MSWLDFFKRDKWTQAILIVLFGVGVVAELPFGQHIVQSILAAHPQLTSLVTTIVGIGLLLMKPKVQEKIKNKTGVDLAAKQEKIQNAAQQVKDTAQQKPK